MTLTIDLTPEQGARLLDAARRAGLEAAEYARLRLLGDNVQAAESGGTIANIEKDDRGRPYIEGTRIKVRMIAEDLMDDRTPADIQASYPHLSLAQIYAAIFYYYQHKNEIDEEIAHGRQQDEEARVRAVQPTREALEERARQQGFVRTPEGLRKTA